MTASRAAREKRAAAQAGPLARLKIDLDEQQEFVYKIRCTECVAKGHLKWSTYRPGGDNGFMAAMDRWIFHLVEAHPGAEAPCLAFLAEAQQRLHERRTVSEPSPALMTMEVEEWLMAGDPAIRWQVLSDLAGAPAEQVAAERARVETEGWGARLLALRDADGQWDGGACFPRRVADDWRAGIQPDFSDGQPWTSTLPTLALLRDLGLDPASESARTTIALVAANCRWEHDGQAFFDGEVEACINGRTLSIGAYFGADVDGLVSGLLAEQLEDGGWNCEAEQGSTVSSYDSTICVLEGLLDYELSGGTVPVAEARRRGEEYLLERQLFRRRSTGEVAAERFLELSWPPRWHYDVLRALEHFRRAGGAPDPRVAEAVQLVRDKRLPDGTWPLENTHGGETYFDLEDGDGRPSRWNTLRALRVLDWYDRRR